MALLIVGTHYNMKNLFLLGLLFVAGCTVQTELGRTDIVVDETQYVTAPENNGYKIGVANYQPELKDNITDERPLQYKLDDKFISFKPTRMYFDGLSLSKVDVKTSLKSANWEYKEVFGKGIDLKMNLGERVWEKLIKINSLKDLGTIPATAQNLIVEFEIETNFVIDGWDRKTDLEITDKIRLGDFSYIKQASVWDSYREEICDNPDEPKMCETLTNRQKVRTVLSARNGKFYISKYLPTDFLQIVQFPVYTDVDVTYGTREEFTISDSTHVSIAVLDTDKFVVCIGDAGGDDLECTAATVSGTNLTYGTPTNIDSNTESTDSEQFVCVAKLETDKFVVMWRDANNDMSAQVATTSGTTINTNVNDIQTSIWGEVFGQASVQGARWCDQLADNTFVVGNGTATGGDGIIATVNSGSSGSIISFGTKVEFESGNTKWPSPCLITADEQTFAMMYEDQDDSDIGKVVIATSTGNTINGFTAPEAFGVDQVNDVLVDCVAIDDDKVAYAWVDQGGSPTLTMQSRVFTIDNQEAITFGTEVEMHTGTAGPRNVNTIKVDTTRYVTIFENQDSTNDGESFLNSVSDTTITAGSSETFDTGNIGGGLEEGMGIALISENKIVICYNDLAVEVGNGFCIIGDIAGVVADNATDGDFICKSGVCRFMGTVYIK